MSEFRVTVHVLATRKVVFPCIAADTEAEAQSEAERRVLDDGVGLDGSDDHPVYRLMRSEDWEPVTNHDGSGNTRLASRTIGKHAQIDAVCTLDDSPVAARDREKRSGPL